MKNIYSAPFYISRIIAWLIPCGLLKTTSNVLGWQGFSWVKFCKCQNLNSFFRKISFLELPKYSWNLQMVSMIEKFKNPKILLKNSWKIGTPFGRRSWKIETPLARWHAKLNNWHTFGTLARLLTHWQVIMRSWHAFGTLARGHVDHAGMHGTYGTQFSKSRTLCGSVNVIKKTTINFYDMTTLRYLVIKEKFE